MVYFRALMQNVEAALTLAREYMGSLGIWAVLDLLPLVTLIKYIDFRVFLAPGGIWVEAQQNSHLGN